MPNVTAPARTMNNGETITYFTDTVGTTAVTWTYPNEQEGLVVTNKGVTNLTLTVNSTNYTITPGGVQTVSAVFTSFTIQSAGGTQQFDAQAWSFQRDMVIAQLSGRKVETVHMRSVRSADDIKTVNVPDGVRGVIVKLKVHAITGSFTAGQGLSMYTNDSNVGSVPGLRLTSGPYSSGIARASHVVYPGAVKGEGTNVSTYETKIMGVPIFNQLAISLVITGTFTTGQGFDCETELIWLV